MSCCLIYSYVIEFDLYLFCMVEYLEINYELILGLDLIIIFNYYIEKLLGEDRVIVFLDVFLDFLLNLDVLMY